MTIGCDHLVEVRTAGDLAALMVRLPPDTEVVMAETVRLDEQLRLGDKPAPTAMLVPVVPVGGPGDLVDDGEYRQDVPYHPGRVVAVVVAKDSTDMPTTAALPAGR